MSGLINRDEQGLSYDEFVGKLFEDGFYLDPGDMSVRHPTSGAVASVEALRDVCKLLPVATGICLNILRAGRAFTCTVDVGDDGLSLSLQIKSQPLLDQIAEAIA